MSLEFWNTIGTMGTFFVIAATAVAALIQLRHLRQNNQLSGLLSILEVFQQPHVHELFDFVRHDLATRMEDPAFRAGLEKIPVDRREHPEVHLCDMYEQIGSCVRSGLIDETLFLQASWYNVILNWNCLEPVIMIARRTKPFVFENFEYLASRAQRWADRHPGGNYPGGTPRMPRLDKWLEKGRRIES